MMKRVLLLLLLLLPLVVRGQEKIVLSTPAFTGNGADFRLWALILRRTHPDGPAAIVATYRESTGTCPSCTFIANGRSISCQYDGAPAETLIIVLNKVNLSTTSLEKRVTTQCQTDLKFGAGTISGSPQ